MAEAEWLYLAGPQERGPVTTEALLALFSAGQISHETLILKKGAKIWKLYGDVFLEPPSGSPPAAQIASAQAITAAAIFPPRAAASVSAEGGWTGTEPNPWRRCFARMIGAVLGNRN